VESAVEVSVSSGALVPVSQADILKTLQLEFDNQVMVYCEMVKSLSERVLGAYGVSSEIFLRLSGLERDQLVLREDVKSAEMEERYERAEELKLSFDENELAIEEEGKRSVVVEAELESLSAQKVGLLSQFHAFQKLHLDKIAIIKSVQEEVVNHAAEEVKELEAETTTVYAAKIELLDERLSDVQGELSRVLEREQKVVNKIASGAQGLVEALKEDEKAATALEGEIASLRTLLVQREAELATLQARRMGNQTKMEALRKEQGGYLEDIVAEKQRKLDLLETLKQEKTLLDAKLLKQHETIEAKQAGKSIEEEVWKTIEEVAAEANRMQEATMASITAFSRPLLQKLSTMTAEEDSDSLEERAISKHMDTSTLPTVSAVSTSSPSSTTTSSSKSSSTSSLESIKADVSSQRKALVETEEELSLASGHLKRSRAEQEALRASLPLTEQSKQAAVASRDYKEAARLKTEIANAHAKLVALDAEATTLTTQLQRAQDKRMQSQARLEKAMEKMRQVEAQNAEARMEALARQTKLIGRTARSLASQPTPKESVLHQPMVNLSIAQLNGIMESIRAEQQYLSSKYRVPIPQDEEEEEAQEQSGFPTVEATTTTTTTTATIAATQSDTTSDTTATDTDSVQPIDSQTNPPSSPSSHKDSEKGAQEETAHEGDADEEEEEEEGGGLFQGLEESSPEDDNATPGGAEPENPRQTEHHGGSLQEEKESDISELMKDEEAAAANANMEELTRQLQALEAARVAAEHDEDYEKAEVIHEECAAIQKQIDALRGGH